MVLAEPSGYYRVTGTDAATNRSSNSWDTEWTSDRLVYLFDMSRGVEILRLKKDATASATMRAVTARSVRRERLAAKPVGRLSGSGWTYICPPCRRG